jgi:hypothetical protein
MTDETLAPIEVRAEASAGLTHCPKCNVIMQKIEGCDAICCPECRFTMCCLCGYSLSPSNYGAELKVHQCKPQNSIDLAIAHRIEQQRIHGAQGGLYIMVVTPKGETVRIPFIETDTVTILQAKIAQRTNIPVQDQNLSYAGIPIKKETVLSNLKLRKGATLTLAARVVGGE